MLGERLQTYAARVVGRSCSRDEAHELVQEAFLRLWQSGESLSEEHARRWLYVTTRRLAIDLRRKRDDRELAFGERVTPTSEAQVEARQGLEQFRDVYAELPPRTQEVLRLKLVDDLDNTDIAAVLDITANHVGVIVHEALTRVRATLRRRL